MEAKLRAVKALVTDADGVLTDGSIFLSGADEYQVFHVRDGLGIKLLQATGIPVAILSGRAPASLLARMKMLGIEVFKAGRIDKQAALLEICAALGIEPAQCAYVGDDLPDLAPIAMAGVSFCPEDAVAEVRARVDYVVPVAGGKGVVRWVAERLLEAKGEWAGLVAQNEVKP